SITAQYLADTNVSGSASTALAQTVNPVTGVTISTTIQNAANVAVASVVLGTTVHDTATLSGQTATAGGTVTYVFWNTGTCTGTSAAAGTVTVTNGVVPNSNPITPTAAGSFSFNATYSGDGNNNRVSSTCEPLTVTAGLTITTAISPSSTITVGASVTDQATITGGIPSTGVTGTVTYNFFNNGACTGTPASSQTVNVGSGNAVPASSSVTPASAGSFAFNATYNGDANNPRTTSNCEPLTVSKTSPTITTSLSTTSVLVGQSATDSA